MSVIKVILTPAASYKLTVQDAEDSIVTVVPALPRPSIAVSGLVAAAQGPQGKSAYQSWLDMGNTGSEQDFLNSLTVGDLVINGGYF